MEAHLIKVSFTFFYFPHFCIRIEQFFITNVICTLGCCLPVIMCWLQIVFYINILYCIVTQKRTALSNLIEFKGTKAMEIIICDRHI